MKDTCRLEAPEVSQEHCFQLCNFPCVRAGNGRLDFNEFATLMAMHMKTQAEMEDELKESFKVFDIDNDGFISSMELRQMMMAMGEKLKPDEIDAIIKQWDRDGDGRIDYNGQNLDCCNCILVRSS
jgi:Ca2+-binding EF-hand superfamily protein